MATTPTAYDAVAYPGAPFPQTHPDRLATLATLYGLSPAPPGHCRVLELGCGDGGNLIPMAYALRESEFLGIDVTRSAVERGRETIDAMGLTNISLVETDLSSVSGLGTFDYVIAHGLYSWVPPAVQERVLSLAREVLAPHGVAFVSFNAYPGNHSTDVVRQLMRFHVSGAADPALKLRQARALVRELSEAVLPDPVLSAILREARDIHDRAQDALLFHDELSDVQESLLFLDFVHRAATHSLQFLSEAHYPDMVVWSDEPAGRLITALGGGDILREQQYRDFLVFRKFRETLLCRDDARPDRPVRPSRIRRLGVASPARPEDPDPDLKSDVPVSFVGPTGNRLTAKHPLTKAALLVLAGIWPSWLPWERLLAVAGQRLTAEGGPAVESADEERLLEFLLDAYATSIVELHAGAPSFVTTVSDRPRISALARREAATKTFVTNLNQRWVALDDDLVRRLVLLLDGTRDREAVREGMARFIRERNPSGADAILATLPEAIERNLNRVATLALLEA